MRRIQNVPPDEISEQVAVASQLFEQDRKLVEEAQKRQAATVAAAEMGIPNEYMERAAQELQSRRAVQARQSHRRKVAGFMATLGIAVTLGVWQVTHPRHHSPPAPLPIVYRLGDATQAHWELHTEAADASMTVNPRQGHGGVITVDITKFRWQAGPENYIADVETNQVPSTLTGYKTASFRVRGQGLGQIRLFLENGDERWVSPFLTAAGPWHQHHLRLNQFLRQTRISPSYNWQDAPAQAPKAVGRIVFKFGKEANPMTEHGEIQIDDLRFE